MNLLVSDFDGTFYDKNYLLNIEFVNKNKNNFDFVIATGRNINSLLSDLKITCKYYICNDSGYILNSNKNIIYRNYIDTYTVNIIYSRILKLGYNEFYFDNIAKISKTPIDNVNKILIKLNNDSDIENMNKILKDLNNAYAYISTNWINIMSIKSRKSNAIFYILKHENYDNIFTIGNNINDYDMLKDFNGYLVTE